MRIRIGYPSADDEREILAADHDGRPGEEVRTVIDPEGLRALQHTTERVTAVPAVLDYVVALAQQTRRLPGVAIGVSPRGSLALLRAARASALLAGRTFVLPDDVKAMAAPVLAHRLVIEGSEDGADRTPPRTPSERSSTPSPSAMRRGCDS